MIAKAQPTRYCTAETQSAQSMFNENSLLRVLRASAVSFFGVLAVLYATWRF